MTATKNVYALMLALVIVLSGCFGTTGTDDTNATSANDLTNWTGDIPNIAVYGNYTANAGNESGYNTHLRTIETSSGEMLNIVEFTVVASSGALIVTTCENGFTTSRGVDGGYDYTTLAFSTLDCIHQIFAYNSVSSSVGEYEAYWSLVYNISPVTVA